MSNDSLRDLEVGSKVTVVGIADESVVEGETWVAVGTGTVVLLELLLRRRDELLRLNVRHMVDEGVYG